MLVMVNPTLFNVLCATKSVNIPIRNTRNFQKKNNFYEMTYHLVDIGFNSIKNNFV